MDHLRAKNTKNDFGIENRRMHEMEMGKKKNARLLKINGKTSFSDLSSLPISPGDSRF